MPSTSYSLLNYLWAVVGAWRDDPRDDAELLARFAEDSDEAVFRVLVWRHGPLVWQTCRRTLGDTPDAEDAFQTTFLALARKAGRLRRGPLAGWLHQVARRAAIDVQANARRRRSLEQRLLTAVRSEKENANHTELYTALDEELASLPERLRIPLVLRYLDGKTLEDVAHIVGCSRRALGKRLARGEAILRERLEGRGLAGVVVSAGTLLSSLVPTSAMPARLIGSTARAAIAFRSGALTGRVAEAARDVLGALSASLGGTTIMRKSLWFVMACCLGLSGAGLVAYQTVNAPLDEPGEASGVATPATRQPKAAPRVDFYGDSLPVGALARMGTVRQWYGRLINRNLNANILAFSPDGKTLASQVSLKAGMSFECESVCLWDTATGREIRRIRMDPENPPRNLLDESTVLTFSPDSRTLATGKGETVCLWAITTGKLLHKWTYQGPQKISISSRR
jgi:RNA polymerase sigma factor (sigma-70 family)